jgi:hypothetical protein
MVEPKACKLRSFRERVARKESLQLASHLYFVLGTSSSAWPSSRGREISHFTDVKTETCKGNE